MTQLKYIEVSHLHKVKKLIKDAAEVCGISYTMDKRISLKVLFI